MSEVLNQENVALPLVVTDAGREAAIAADDAGLQLSLTEIALGDGLWQPDGSATQLQNEIKRITNLGGSDVAPDRLHLTVTDDSTDAYELGEFGLYTDTGILFALYSQDTYISEKISESILMVSADMKLDTVPPGSVTIEGNNFQYPPATETVAGVAEIATQAEVDGGVDSTRMVVPLKLSAWWDGVRYWDNIQGKPDSFPPSEHTHDWDEVTGKPDYATRWPSYAEVTDKPATFPPSSHTHQASEITDLDYPVDSVNGQTGAVNLDADDVGARPDDYVPGWNEITGKPATFPPSSHTHPANEVKRIVGELCFFSFETAPSGFFSLDGSTIPNGVNDFPDLASSGSLFVTQSGSDLILADCADFIRGKGSSDRDVGEYESDAIRNITGQAGSLGPDDACGFNRGSNGAIYTSGNATRILDGTGGESDQYLNFDASRVVPTASENRPKSLTALVCIYHGVLS